MHARWLVEIATLFVVPSTGTSVPGDAAQTSATHRYWAMSRQRFERWQSQLSLHRARLVSAGASRRVALWKELRPTLEEIFLSDVLTRVVAAFGARLESAGIDSDIGPVVHSVHSTQEDIRNRCLRLLVTPGLPVEQAVDLNRVRFALEHWTDTFLGQLPSGFVGIPFSFNPERTRDFMDEAAEHSTDQTKYVGWQLMAASCQKWMLQNCASVSANPLLNQQIGEATLAMLRPERFPSLSPFPALAGDRLGTLLDQTDLWVKKLLYTEAV